MTERTIFTGTTPQIVIRSGGNVTVKGQDSDQVLAETSGAWGLQLKRKKGVFEVQIGGNGQVFVPNGSRVKIYAGKSADIQDVQGTVGVVAGWDVRIARCQVLAQASAGHALEIDCQQVEGRELRFSSGWHLRCWIRSLANVRYQIDDIGGKWQATLGAGETSIQLKAGGDVTLVTDQPIRESQDKNWLAQNPIGKIVRPEVS